MTQFPSDVFFIFETQSLVSASPFFIQNIRIVNTQDADVTKEALFTRKLKLTKEKNKSRSSNVSKSTLRSLKIAATNDFFFNSSFSKLVKIQYVAKFCQNIVFNSQNTGASDILGIEPIMQSKPRREDAIADIFCYEAMRRFGDRIMRPSFSTEFMGKLSEICQKEFLCAKYYSPSYIENLTLGNYHIREPKAPIKMMNMSAQHHRLAAT